MTRYLVVAHQTAESSELMEMVGQLLQSEPRAEFALLVPATPVEHLLTWDETESRSVAAEQARRAKALFEREGAYVIRAIVGDASPMHAIGDELRAHPEHYGAIVIATFPAHVSRWLQLDLPNQAKDTFGLPVIHVEAQPQTSSVRAR